MSLPLSLAIAGIGVWAPEFVGWEEARTWLTTASGEPEAASVDGLRAASSCESLRRPEPSLLPPAERRRAPAAVRLALVVAEQACAMAGCAPAELPHVFASGYGDSEVTDQLCATLARAPRELSPTRFHHSVHNAAAGYWTIATGCRRVSTALSAGTESFAAALLEAALLRGDEDSPVLLVAYDVPASGVLEALVPCRTPFAVGLVLAPPIAPCARLALRPVTLASGPTSLQACGHRANPAAQSLPLLAALARGLPETLLLGAGSQWALQVQVHQ
jgi:hypothetical protein